MQQDNKNSDKKLQSLIGVPANTLIQEANNLYVWVQEDRTMLMKAGLEWKLVENIPDQINKCKDLAAQWYVKKNEQSDVTKQLNAQVREARELHAEIRRGFRYAFRGDKTLMKKVFTMSGYRIHAQIIQDLNNLCVMGKGNINLLDRINFNHTLLDKAAYMSDNLAKLISERENEKAEKRVFYDTVKAACLDLKESISKIRACGRYVFADNKERLVGYRSQYRHVHRGKRSQK